jgi:hypothetical protein
MLLALDTWKENAGDAWDPESRDLGGSAVWSFGCATVEYLLNPWEHSIAQEGWRAVTGSMQGTNSRQRSMGAETVVSNRERCCGSENVV